MTHSAEIIIAQIRQSRVETARPDLQASIKTANAQVTHEPLPRLPVDATQIMQLFQNLIGNAVTDKTAG